MPIKVSKALIGYKINIALACSLEMPLEVLYYCSLIRNNQIAYNKYFLLSGTTSAILINISAVNVSIFSHNFINIEIN